MLVVYLLCETLPLKLCLCAIVKGIVVEVQ